MWTFYLPMLAVLTVITAQKDIAEVRYNWNYINYTWQSPEQYNQAIANGDYILKNNVLVGIRVWKNKFYVALPRLKPGVPVTLATIPYQPMGDNRSPNLKPYPNWKMQNANNCKESLQTVQAMEIDPSGRMWVINIARVIYRNTTKTCSHRLIVFDLENNDKILLDYEFPKNVVDPNTGYLNDIVLDHTDGGYAYITNSDEVKPSIIIFSLATMSSWQVTDDESMKAKDINFSVKGEPIEFTKPSTVNGIALEFADLEDHRALYFTPLSSTRKFYIYTTFLKSKKNISEYIHYLDSTPKTHTAGMIINSKNELFFGMLEDNSVGLWDSSTTPSEGSFRVAYSDPKLQWIDTYAIDVTGNMWATINRLPRSNADKIDINKINYRVVKLDRRDSKNYQYYSDGRVPRLPVIKC